MVISRYDDYPSSHHPHYNLIPPPPPLIYPSPPSSTLPILSLCCSQLESLVDRTVLCSDEQITKTTLTYLTELGDIPLMGSNTTVLDGIMRITRTTKGTKKAVQCADHGFCNYLTGECQCFTGFTSSDYDGEVGPMAECGYRSKRTGDLTFLHIQDF